MQDKIEKSLLQHQPKFSNKEFDWWHSITVDGMTLDVQYLEDEDTKLYVYEVKNGKRVEQELMVIPVDWEYDTVTNKFKRRV